MKNYKDIRILFMGTPRIAAITLRRLIESGFNIVGVVAQVDKEVGRKHILEKVPTKVVAEEFNIPVYQPLNIKNDYEFIKKIEPDLILTLAYGQIIPQGLIDVPKMGCLNLHGSILPKYRGAAPIQRAILDGEKETGISLMAMVDKMDAGDVYAVKKVAIEEDDNYSTLSDKLANVAYEIVMENIDDYINNKIIPTKQDESLVTIAKKIKPEDEKLNKDLSSTEFINRVRALAMTPGAYIIANGKKIKIYKATKSNPLNNEVGEITIHKGMYITLKDGTIEIKELQLEGKKIMDAKSFANGAKSFDKIIIE